MGSIAASPLHGSGSLMSSGYCLCEDSVHAYASMWVSSGFSGVLPALKIHTGRWIAYYSIVCRCVPALHAVFVGCESCVITFNIFIKQNYHIC